MTDPNENLAQAYVKKAERALSCGPIRGIQNGRCHPHIMQCISGYAIMMRAGIRCEIHSCTIESSIGAQSPLLRGELAPQVY